MEFVRDSKHEENSLSPQPTTFNENGGRDLHCCFRPNYQGCCELVSYNWRSCPRKHDCSHHTQCTSHHLQKLHLINHQLG